MFIDSLPNGLICLVAPMKAVKLLEEMETKARS